MAKNLMIQGTMSNAGKRMGIRLHLLNRRIWP